MNELIERLRTRANEERAVPDMGHNAAERERSKLIRLLTEAADALEAAREDAERYRWLRDRMAAEEITDETYARLALRTVGPIAKRPADSNYCDELDAVVDQARGKKGENGT